MRKCLLVFLMLIVTTGAGYSYTIDATNYNTALGFATVTSSPGGLVTKTVGGFTGIGVAGGFVDGEIDLAGPEHVYVNYTVPNRIDSIRLGFLFTEGNFGDAVSEVARVVASVNPWIAGDLTATTAFSGTWTSSGSVTNISPGNEANAGVWEILNPFGDFFTSSLDFYAVLNSFGGATAGASNSDFSIVSIKSTPASIAVPEPATWLLLGAGLICLGGYGRKRLN